MLRPSGRGPGTPRLRLTLAPPPAAPAPALAHVAAARALLVALHLRDVLAGEDLLPLRQLVVALPGRGHRELEHRQRLGKIALLRERLRGRPAPPPLAGEDGLREQD